MATPNWRAVIVRLPIPMAASAHTPDRRSPITRFREVGVVAFLLVIALVTTLAQPRFLQPENLRSILLDIPLLVVVAMGMTAVIVSRNIDLSVGANLGLSGMIVGMLFRDHPGLPIAAGVLIGILCGALLGAFNGFLITACGVPAIIATLGTLSVYRGLVFVISNGVQVDPVDLPPELIRLSQTSPIGLPWIVLLALVIAGAAHLLLTYHRAGRAVYAIGGNPEAARLAGIGVSRYVFGIFLVTGALSGLAGVMYASRFGFINPGQTGVGFELNVIAATVIGGTQVFGGVGTAFGTFLGCLLLGVINNALSIAQLSAFWQLAVYGAIILLALLADSMASRRGQRRAASGA